MGWMGSLNSRPAGAGHEGYLQGARYSRLVHNGTGLSQLSLSMPYPFRNDDESLKIISSIPFKFQVGIFPVPGFLPRAIAEKNAGGTLKRRRKAGGHSSGEKRPSFFLLGSFLIAISRLRASVLEETSSR